MRFASLVVTLCVVAALGGCGDAGSGDDADGDFGGDAGTAGPSDGPGPGVFAPRPIIGPPRPEIDAGDEDATVPERDAGQDAGRDAGNPCGNGVLDDGEVCDSATDLCCNDTCDGPRAADTVCRPQLGGCDVEEVCDGATFACPADDVEPALTVCRAKAGACDIAELCNGVAKTCPSDVVQPNTFMCALTGGMPCDADDYCDGTNKACPDLVAAAATSCGSVATGICDLDDQCDGSSKACPDLLKASTDECRAAVNDCDVAELCSGVDKTCPMDVLVGNGVACGSSNDDECDNPDTCDGAGSCLPNHEGSGVACGDQGVECHNDDTCDGNGACTDNGLFGAGDACGSTKDDECANPDTCDALGNCQPNDEPIGTACGDQGLDCHFDDACDGNGACTDNGFWGIDTPCGDTVTNTECDFPDACDAAGSCLPNYASFGDPCGDQGIDCRNDDACDGTGGCTDNGLWPDLDACDLPSPDPQGAAVCSAGLCCPGATRNDGTGCAFNAEDNIVFLTSAPMPNAYFGNVAQADAHCQMLALDANLAGTFHAWLSDSTSPPDRYARNRVSDGPYRDVAGNLVSAAGGELLDGTLDVPIELVELNLQAAVPVVTGTLANGDVGPSNCVDWTSPSGQTVIGQSNQSDTRWTQVNMAACSDPAFLYCFQDDCPGQADVDFMNDPENCGACGNRCNGTCALGTCQGIVFVTAETVNGAMNAIAGSGLTNADAVCQNAADNASPNPLPGTYRAWLSTDTVDAWTRILDQPYLTLDGTTVLTNLADLPTTLGGIGTDETGSPSGASLVWTGSTDDGALFDVSQSCNNWTASTNADAGVVGGVGLAGAGWSQGDTSTCEVSLPLYCFQVGPLAP